MAGISEGRPRVVCDLRVVKTLLAHHVAKDFFETTERLAFKRQPQSQVSAVFPKPLAERLEVGFAEPFRADDLYTCNDVMRLHWQATNAGQRAIILATEHHRPRQKDAS
jgi:hypothetical protein